MIDLRLSTSSNDSTLLLESTLWCLGTPATTFLFNNPLTDVVNKSSCALVGRLDEVIDSGWSLFEAGDLVEGDNPGLSNGLL